MKSTRCCVYDCKGSKDPTTYRHRFPSGDPEAFKVWIERTDPALGTLDFKSIYNKYRVCSLHFEESCYAPGLKKLKRGSLPSKFVPNYENHTLSCNLRVPPGAANSETTGTEVDHEEIVAEEDRAAVRSLGSLLGDESNFDTWTSEPNALEKSINQPTFEKVNFKVVADVERSKVLVSASTVSEGTNNIKAGSEQHVQKVSQKKHSPTKKKVKAQVKRASVPSKSSLLRNRLSQGSPKKKLKTDETDSDLKELLVAQNASIDAIAENVASIANSLRELNNLIGNLIR